ncbi:MAG TPA: ATP synthase subunit I [Dissulfurispiraceae bacterium]
MIRRISKQSALILIPVSIISIFFTQWRFPVGILVGGAVGIGNLRGLSWSLNALLGLERSGGKIVFLSIFRLLVVFALLVLLAGLRLIDPFGLLVGLTVVFVLIMKEGLLAAKKANEKPQEGQE